jgi:ribosomal 30S subunit maturation factor RimM
MRSRNLPCGSIIGADGVEGNVDIFADSDFAEYALEKWHYPALFQAWLKPVGNYIFSKIYINE